MTVEKCVITGNLMLAARHAGLGIQKKKTNKKVDEHIH